MVDLYEDNAGQYWIAVPKHDDVLYFGTDRDIARGAVESIRDNPNQLEELYQNTHNDDIEPLSDWLDRMFRSTDQPDLVGPV